MLRDVLDRAFAAQHQRCKVRCVETQIQQRIVELAQQCQRPDVRAHRAHLGNAVRQWRIGTAQRHRGGCENIVEHHFDMSISQAFLIDRAFERCQQNAGLTVRTIRSGRQFGGACRNRLFELRARCDFVDQPPLQRARPTGAFLERAEHVGDVAPDASLVGETRQPAGAGQHREQRHFRQRHGGVAVIDQQQVIGGEREFVAAAGSGAAERGEIALARLRRGLFDRVTRFVGELAEVHFVGVRRAGEHADVGTGAEDARLA